MASQEAYDRERRVSHIHEEPTADVVREDATVRRVVPRERVSVDRGEDVVIEHRAAPYEEVVVDHGGYAADDVRDDVTIDHVVERRAMLDRVSDVVWFFVGLLEASLALRIVFLLLEANQDSGFVSFIDGLTDPFVRPFDGIFTNPSSDGAVLDTGALLAMVIYALLAWALVRLIWLLFDRQETGAYRSVSHIHRDRI